MREKGGLVFRFYPFKGWFWFWFFDPVIYSQSSSLLLLVLITCSYYLYVCSVWSKSRAFYVFGLVVENFPESQKPVDKSHGGCRAERRKKPQDRLSVAGRPMEIGRPFKRCERRIFGWETGFIPVLRGSLSPDVVDRTVFRGFALNTGLLTSCRSRPVLGWDFVNPFQSRQKEKRNCGSRVSYIKQSIPGIW